MSKDLPPPIVSIVIPVINQPALTVKCFQAIRANTKLPYEIIWVDNGSNPESFGVIRRQATREYVILLNNDTEVSWKWATKLIKPFLTDNNTVGAVGPVTQSKMAWQEGQHLNKMWKLGIPRYRQGYHDSYHTMLEKKFAGKYINVGNKPLSFFCAAFRRSIFSEVGLLCEEFSVGLGDDDEYCMRLRANGYKIMLSLDTFVYHAHRTTFNALNLGVDSLRRHNLKVLRRKEKELRKKFGS